MFCVLMGCQAATPTEVSDEFLGGRLVYSDCHQAMIRRGQARRAGGCLAGRRMRLFLALTAAPEEEWPDRLHGFLSSYKNDEQEVTFGIGVYRLSDNVSVNMSSIGTISQNDIYIVLAVRGDVYYFAPRSTDQIEFLLNYEAS
jgi:hypothetical protein